MVIVCYLKKILLHDTTLRILIFLKIFIAKRNIIPKMV